MSSGSSPLHIINRDVLIVPASMTSFSSIIRVEIAGVPLHTELVARTVIVTVLTGAIKFGMMALNVVFVPIDVKGPKPVMLYSNVVLGSAPGTSEIVKVTVSPGQNELLKERGLIVTLGTLETLTVTVSERSEQDAESMVRLAVSGKLYTKTSTSSPLTSV